MAILNTLIPCLLQSTVIPQPSCCHAVHVFLRQLHYKRWLPRRKPYVPGSGLLSLHLVLAGG
jgi:hypothetical protein